MLEMTGSALISTLDSATTSQSTIRSLCCPCFRSYFYLYLHSCPSYWINCTALRPYNNKTIQTSTGCFQLGTAAQKNKAENITAVICAEITRQPLLCWPGWMCVASLAWMKFVQMFLCEYGLPKRGLRLSQFLSPLKMRSSFSWSKPSLWHFLQSPVAVELYRRLQRDSTAEAGGRKSRLARRSAPPPLGSTRRGRFWLEM